MADKPKFMSFAEATAWAMEQIKNVSPEEVVPGFNAETDLFSSKELVKQDEIKEECKEVKYQRWLIEVGELKEQLETQLDNAQDLWMMGGDEFKGWMVKSKADRWYHVDMAMKEVYSHIDSAIFFLKIIRGEDKK